MVNKVLNNCGDCALIASRHVFFIGQYDINGSGRHGNIAFDFLISGHLLADDAISLAKLEDEVSHRVCQPMLSSQHTFRRAGTLAGY